MTAALPSVTLDTARLRLRAHREDDLGELVTLAGVWDVASWLTKLPHPYTDDHGRSWIAHVRQAHAAGDPRTFRHRPKRHGSTDRRGRSRRQQR